MEIITVNSNNIDIEHICCSISEKKGENCVGSKKAWMKARFDDGLVFKKLNVRGKVFIEYIPAEKAFAPINAPGYIYIDCFWVSGKYKGNGHANQLLKECIKDAKALGAKGLVALSSTKKKPFLSDPGYYKYKGFKIADTALPYYELLYLPFKENADVPSFKPCAKTGKIENRGIVLYYSNQCPHTEKYVSIINDVAKEAGVGITINKLSSYKEAQLCPAPFTTYTLYKNGEFITNEILTEKKFINLIKK